MVPSPLPPQRSLAILALFGLIALCLSFLPTGAQSLSPQPPPVRRASASGFGSMSGSASSAPVLGGKNYLLKFAYTDTSEPRPASALKACETTIATNGGVFTTFLPGVGTCTITGNLVIGEGEAAPMGLQYQFQGTAWSTEISPPVGLPPGTVPPPQRLDASSFNSTGMVTVAPGKSLTLLKTTTQSLTLTVSVLP